MGLSISIANSILSDSMIEGLSPVNIVPPVVSGVGLVGQTLSSTTGTWSGSVPISYSYQWKRNGSSIIGANSSSYLLVTADGDTDVTCTVTATNTKGVSSSVSNSIAVIGYDPNAYAFFQATGITDPVIKDAVDILVKDLKLYNIWSKMKAIYPFVGGTATTHKFNLVNPADTDAAFRLAFSGGWTHSSTGVAPNGVNAFANTFFNPRTSLTIGSNSQGQYQRLNQTDWGFRGVWDAGTAYRFEICTQSVSYAGNSRTIANGTDINPGPIADTRGLVFSKSQGGIFKFIRNNTTISFKTSGTTIYPNRPYYLGANNNNATAGFFSNMPISFSFLGDGLTDTEAANLYTAVQAFQTTLNRQV